MALIQLTEEEIRTWTRAQKDQWWFKNVFRGDMPQLTIRSALTGFLLGGVLAATALYIGAKTGISIGVGLTSVILAFALYRIMHSVGVAHDFTILENNCTQSIATAAGYMVAPMISSLAAYMLVTGKIILWWHMIVWMCVVSIIGVLLAFPMKRRFINEDQLPFPEGRASGVVLDALYTVRKAPHVKARCWHQCVVRVCIIHRQSAAVKRAHSKSPHRSVGRRRSVCGHSREARRLLLAAAAKAKLGSHILAPIYGSSDCDSHLRGVSASAADGDRVATSCLIGAFLNLVI